MKKHPLTNARLKRSLTLAQASKLVGTTPATFSRWESYKRCIPDSWKTLLIKQFTELSYEDLLNPPINKALTRPSPKSNIKVNKNTSGVSHDL